MTLNHSKIEITSGNFKRMLGRIYFESVKSVNYDDTGNSMLRILANILKMLTSFLPWKRYEKYWSFYLRYVRDKMTREKRINTWTFDASVPFLQPLKVTKNHRFSDIFSGHENGKLALLRLNWFQQILTSTAGFVYLL